MTDRVHYHYCGHLEHIPDIIVDYAAERVMYANGDLSQISWYEWMTDIANGTWQLVVEGPQVDEGQ